MKVTGAAKYEQAQRDVAAAVSIVTRSEIKAFGWRTLAQALASLPGVHASYDRQYTYLATRGFEFSGTMPRTALIWQAAAGTTLKALYGRARRAHMPSSATLKTACRKSPTMRSAASA